MTEKHWERIDLRVTGVVQGVGFRYWTRREAQRLGLRGSVRNAADGSVEVVAAGVPERLQEMVRLLKHGPPGARVSALEPFDSDDSDPPFPFEIVR
jgi:acylphosphatase